MSRYIRDLIDLPVQIHRGDFVLRLTEGVEHPRETVDSYVVTPQLVEAFDNALGFIRSALQSPTSKAAYLHGSFGSGKSHFMAVLHFLLKGDPRARAILNSHPSWRRITPGARDASSCWCRIT